MNSCAIAVVFLAVVAVARAAPEKQPTAAAREKPEYLRSPVGDPAASRAFQQRLKQRFVSMPTPEYPYEARRTHQEGHGRYRIHVDTTGKITEVEALQSPVFRLFDDAVRAAFRRWRGKPGPPLIVELPVRFVLDRNGSAGSRSPSPFADHPLYMPGPQPAPANR